MSAVGCNKSESKNITNTAETSSELQSIRASVEESTGEVETTVIEQLTTENIVTNAEFTEISQQTTVVEETTINQQITTNIQSIASPKVTQQITTKKQSQVATEQQTTTKTQQPTATQQPTTAEETTNHSPSENSTINVYSGGGLNGTYKTYTLPISKGIYNEYVIENVIIEKEDMTETKFKVTVTFTATMISKMEGSPDYIKGEWQFVKDGRYLRGGGTYSVSNVSVGEMRQITFTNYNMEEGDYWLTFSSL